MKKWLLRWLQGFIRLPRLQLWVKSSFKIIMTQKAGAVQEGDDGDDWSTAGEIAGGDIEPNSDQRLACLMARLFSSQVMPTFGCDDSAMLQEDPEGVHVFCSDEEVLDVDCEDEDSELEGHTTMFDLD